MISTCVSQWLENSGSGRKYNKLTKTKMMLGRQNCLLPFGMNGRSPSFFFREICDLRCENLPGLMSVLVGEPCFVPGVWGLFFHIIFFGYVQDLEIRSGRGT